MLFVIYIALTILSTFFRSWAISILWNLFMPRLFNLPMVSTLAVVGVLLMVSMFSVFSVDTLPSDIEDKEDILARANWSLVINMVLTGITLLGGVICSLYL